VKSTEAIARAKEAAPAPVSAANLRCDVRGMRVDEALREIEAFLDRTMRAGDPAATILHGHGTGALKQSVRDFLAASPYVRLFRPGETHEGGDGVTLVMLRG
jgi:DNA mismatch repair protein MutS2